MDKKNGTEGDHPILKTRGKGRRNGCPGAKSVVKQKTGSRERP